MEPQKEPVHRRGNKTHLRLSTRRRKRCFHTRTPKVVPADENLENVLEFEEMDENIDQVTTAIHEEIAMDIEVDKQDSEEIKLDGRRIIAIQNFLDDIKSLCNHNNLFNCGFEHMRVVKEVRTGFSSNIYFKCSMCHLERIINTDTGEPNINQAAAIGIINSGSGYAQLKQVTASLDVPCISENYYQVAHDQVCKSWEDTALKSMQEAALEEYRLAVEAGDVTDDGKATITVVADGSWAKRSYRKNYNSLSGAAAIVGYRTKKLLFLGIRNRYCYDCAIAKQQNVNPVHAHKCYKNWTDTSCSMEADIVCEGFAKSISMYNLIYESLIGDGDSSCYMNILKLDPYRAYSIRVRIVECRNHLLRNYVNKISDLVSNCSAGPLILRKSLDENKLRLRAAVTKAIAFRKNMNCSQDEKIRLLKEDLVNGPSHIFGEHAKCAELGYFCKEQFQNNSTYSDMKLCDMQEKINEFVSYLSRHANSLILDVDNNIVEQFNSIVCKYIGGKRVNYCLKRSYQGRCSAAAVSFNTKTAMSVVSKEISGGRSPNKSLKKYYTQLNRRRECLKERIRKRNIRRQLFTNKDSSKNSTSYGEHCQKADMSDDEFQKAKEKLLLKYNLSNEKLTELERDTRLQRRSLKWKEERSKRVTASNFSEVCKKRITSTRTNLVKDILYPTGITTSSMQWGIDHEHEALECLAHKLNVTIEECGLFVDLEHQFIGASPDGLINDGGIVEVKCPYSARNLTPDEGILQGKIKFWNKKTGLINKNDKWYYQVQGQLQVAKKNYCVFGVWTPKGFKQETVFRDSNFFNTKMLKPLKDFFYDALLPELVDSRYMRNMPIREPPYVVRRERKKRIVINSPESY